MTKIVINWRPPKPKSKIFAFIQARIGSKRFPDKIHQDIDGETMLSRVIKAVKKSQMIDDIVIVSPQPIESGQTKNCVFSEENNVLGRYRAALEKFPCDYVVRITADCPLLDSYLIDQVVQMSLGYDYGSNILGRTFPDGMDVEVISAGTLVWLDDKIMSDYDREHVTTYIRDNPEVQRSLKIVNVESFTDYSNMRLTVDTQEDLDRIKEYV